MSGTVSQSAPLEKIKKSKRSRTEGESTKEKKSKKTKRTESLEEAPTEEGSEPAAESKVEEKEGEKETAGIEADAKKVKKSKKDKKDKNEKKPTTSLPPQLDASDVPATTDESMSSEPALSAQATKAIEYAKTIGTPAFKFAKAKQGWLMRNVFSTVEIPESSLKTVLEYLKTVKGGSREHLIQQARALLVVPPSTEAAASTSTPEDSEQTPDQTEEADPGPEPTGPEEVESEETKKDRESKLERANLVLTALGVALSE